MSMEYMVDINGIGYTQGFKIIVRAPGYVEASSCLCTVYDNGKAQVMFVDSVETVEGYREQGYATRLMEEVMILASKLKVDSVELLTNEDNQVAQRLYSRAGMVKTGKIHWRRILNRW